MSSLIVRASGECSIQQVKFKYEKTYFQVQDTYQTKGGPEIQQNTRSQREVSIGSNRAANQAVYQALNISITSYRVVNISRH